MIFIISFYNYFNTKVLPNIYLADNKLLKSIILRAIFSENAGGLRLNQSF
jgi:hypothetical protein